MSNKPQIATILENGEYGQRDMTDEEITALEEMKANAQEIDNADRITNA